MTRSKLWEYFACDRKHLESEAGPYTQAKGIQLGNDGPPHAFELLNLGQNSLGADGFELVAVCGTTELTYIFKRHRGNDTD